MASDREEMDVKIPSDVTAVVAEFADRGAAERCVEELTRAGFGTDQISFVARGAETVNGRFVPGALLITVHATGREDRAERVLRGGGARDVKRGSVSAVGDVVEEGAEREEATAS
jgi:hypothetical protein